ncbi:hypothetical protein [[Mycoplasma] testudinis]|uniref:hypothetical protein n=1 Tax=[Mycoplasma] testudinis TaxID=33924 RepID=UPI00047FF7F9|nr:hypothetical protein [[Mycoplasma] testudinis]
MGIHPFTAIFQDAASEIASSNFVTSLDNAYSVIAGIGVVFVILVGAPHFITLLRTKNSEEISLASFWIFFSSLVAFCWLGTMTRNLELVIAEFLAVMVFGAQMFLIVRYRKVSRLSMPKKYISYSIIVLYVAINVMFMGLTGGKIFGPVSTPLPIVASVPPNSVVSISSDEAASLNNLALFPNVLAPVLLLTSFIPQTIIGIRKKNLPAQPYTYIFIVVIYNGLWTIAWAIQIAKFQYIIDQLNAANTIAAIPGIKEVIQGNSQNLGIYSFQFILQFLSFAFCVAQLAYWHLQHKELIRKTGKKHYIWY